MPSKRELKLMVEELDRMNGRLKDMFNELHEELDTQIHDLKMGEDLHIVKLNKKEKKKEIKRLEKKIDKLKDKIEELYEGKRGWAFW